MNTIVIESIADYANKRKIIEYHGKKYNVNGTKYKELAPCCVEVKTKCIEAVAKFSLECKTKKIKYDAFRQTLQNVLHGTEDFTEIKGSDYMAEHYTGDVKAFCDYKNERENKLVTRRQFMYQLSKRSCMNEIQFFEEEGFIILNFRSCDYIKKFPFDLLLIKILIDEFNIKCDKIYCLIGSLHIYNGD